MPSDEDSQTFTVNFASGETYKLRAENAKERQVKSSHFLIGKIISGAFSSPGVKSIVYLIEHHLNNSQLEQT